MDSSAAPYRLDAENPWPGLAWFDESAAQFFNGREREIAELKRVVLEAPLTVLFGRSGLGKTSLLKAGLFPVPRQANLLPVYLRFDFTPPDTRDTSPLVDQLVDAFTRACAAVGADAPPREEGETLWEYLHRTDVTVWSSQNAPLVPLFVVDQFEEVFTLGPVNAAAVLRLREDLADLAENRIPVGTEERLATDEHAASRFALRGRRYRLLLSFREDFATAFERWHELPSLMRNRVQLLPMTGEQAFDAVYGSASHLMDEDTAVRIVRFVASEKRALPSDGETDVTPLAELVVEPALLSLVCRGLNEGRKIRHTRGGRNCIDRELLASAAAGVVNSHYDECMSDQPERVHRFVECELITESGFRKPCAQDDALREPYGVSLDSLRDLVDRRLLRIEPSLGVTRVELIHDLLTPTVVTRRDGRRHADRKRRLDEELREQEETRQAVEAVRQARRRTRLVAGLAAVAILVATAVGALATYMPQTGWDRGGRGACRTLARVGLGGNHAARPGSRTRRPPRARSRNRLAHRTGRVSAAAGAVRVAAPARGRVVIPDFGPTSGNGSPGRGRGCASHACVGGTWRRCDERRVQSGRHPSPERWL